jgi:L-fuculose-phosphate aldolase
VKATLGMTKAELMEQAQGQMREHLIVEAWSSREKIALACRILFEAGHDSGLAGQITARDIQPGTFLTQRLGLGFDEIQASNLLLVDENLEVLEGSGMPNPANRFHTWIYRSRPDVRCIIHTHPFYSSALSTLECPLIVSHMDTCALFEDCALLEKWPGVPVGNEEGEIITAALGDKRAILLAHHGQLVACSSIEEACVLSLQFERAARMQMIAQAAGEMCPLSPALAREAHDWLLTPSRLEATFAYYARRVLRSDARASKSQC